MKKKIIIEGMSCNHCVMHSTNALKELEGVTNVEVGLANKTGILEANKEVSDEEIKSAIEEVGYEVVSIETIEA